MKIISRKQAYQGPVFGVTTYELKEPGGIKVRRDVVTHSGSVVILALAEPSRGPEVLLVRQYRHPARDYLWELPAGRKDEGEELLAAAKRELLEETGISARKWKHGFRFWASPGFLDETMDIFLAQGLTHGDAHPEEDENIEVNFVPLPRALRMVMQGIIVDAKTMTGILWLARKLHI
ncbi:MAG: NUDIX hydrolase [Acidobacteriaceae bacterium]